MTIILRLLFSHTVLLVLMLWLIANSWSELSRHVYPSALVIFIALLSIQSGLSLLRRHAYLSKKSMFFVVIIFLIALRMIYDFEPSKVRELLVGTTGGILLFYVLGSLVSFNMSICRELWRMYPLGGALSFLCLIFAIILSYLSFINLNSQDQGIMPSFINADGSYQRKGSILTLIYIISVLAYIYSSENLNKLRKYHVILMIPFTATLLFYSQYVRSNAAFVTILAIYLFVILYDFSNLKLKTKLKIFYIGLISISSALVFIMSVFPELLDFFSYFRVFGYGKFEFSSVTSRINLFVASLDQFNYGPIFGDLNSDLKADQAGKYPHSLLAHALTHLGLVGFVMISLACVALLTRGKFDVLVGNLIKKNPTIVANGHLTTIIFPIVCISVLFQTITWAPFWFTVGLTYPIIVWRRFKHDE